MRRTEHSSRWDQCLWPDRLTGLRRRRRRPPPQAGAREAVSALTLYLAADTAVRAQTQRYFCAFVLLPIFEVFCDPLDWVCPCDLSM